MELTTTARKLHTAVADGQWKALEELDLPARLVSMVRDLDLYLTGKSNNRDPARDLDRSERFVTGEIWEIYLSDGGYSRVVLQIAGMHSELELALSDGNFLARQHPDEHVLHAL